MLKFCSSIFFYYYCCYYYSSSFSVCIFLWVLWMCVGFCGIVPCKCNQEQRWKARFWFANNSTSTVLVKWSHTTLDFLLAIFWFCKMGDLESHCLSAKPPANNFIFGRSRSWTCLTTELVSWLFLLLPLLLVVADCKDRNIILYLLTEVLVGSTPHPVTVTTRIIPFLIGNPYKPSFVTVTGWGVDQKYWSHHGNLLDKLRLASPIFGIQEAVQHAFLCEVVSLDDILGADLVNKEAIVKQPLGRLGLWFQV